MCKLRQKSLLHEFLDIYPIIMGDNGTSSSLFLPNNRVYVVPYDALCTIVTSKNNLDF